MGNPGQNEFKLLKGGTDQFKEERPLHPQFHLGYRPGLDGIRGIAILLVLLEHGKILGNGFSFIGVNTFFVLSGFLITCLLVEEYDKTGGINFRHFYFRRALRLLPALLAMLVAFVIFAFLFDPHGLAVQKLNEALFALFYFTNWAAIFGLSPALYLGHTWSLSVEEQFYIIWPLILLCLLRRNTRSSMLCWLFLGAFLSVVIRVGLLEFTPTNFFGNIYPVDPKRLMGGTDTRADSLLLGCFGAVLLSSNLLPSKKWLVIVLQPLSIIAGMALLALGTCRPQSSWMICGGWSLAAILGMVTIMCSASLKGGPINWILENPALTYTGQISYGLYIWHAPILVALRQHNLPWRNLEYLVFVVPIVLLSYYLIERPCLRLKNQFSAVKDGSGH
jgi:peptidoglycan/LPS O-acetylase OafA/YrhL